VQHGTSDAGNERGFPAIAVLMLRLKPIPASGHVSFARLAGINDHEAFGLRELVHACCRSEVIRVLFAAMEHDDQRKRCPS
jgi:hypothetical protein